MLNTTELRAGMQCLYKRQTLTYQRTITTGTSPYHVFKTRTGKDKRLSEQVTSRDVWVEIIAEATAAPTRE